MSRSTRLDRLSMSTSLSQSTLARISQQRRMKQTPGSGEEPLQYRVDLLSVARHELKTPLTVLKMQIQLLQRKVERQNADTFADIVARIETQVDKLERLSRDLLDISSIQAPAYTREIIDLDALLSESREVM